MKTHVEFRSDKFPPYPDEDDTINPGLHGRHLGEFLTTHLQSKGFHPERLIAEDWGWILPIRNKDFHLWLCLGNYQEYSDGFLMWIEPHKGVIRKWFKKINTQPTVKELQNALNEILQSDPSIYDIKWWTHEEFNNHKC